MTTLDVYLSAKGGSVSLHGAWHGPAHELWMALFNRCREGGLGRDWSGSHANVVMPVEDVRDMTDDLFVQWVDDSAEAQQLAVFLRERHPGENITIEVIEF